MSFFKKIYIHFVKWSTDHTS